MPKIDETVIGFAVYEDATEYIGISEVTLPEISNITEEISGAGIGGKIESVILGAIEAMSLGLYPDSGVTGYGNDQIWMRCHGERLPFRGSAFSIPSNSGPSALYLRNPRSYSAVDVGFRSAFVE